MFGPVNYANAPPEVCHCNCPRIYAVPDSDNVHAPAGGTAGISRTAKDSSVPTEFRTEAGRQLYPVMRQPCYLLIRLTRPHCRALRNYIITNSTRLSVVKGDYCGIANKVFNVRSDIPDAVQSMGLLRFSSTEQAYRFASDEAPLANKDFLGGRFDVWCLTLCSPDRSVIPSPTEPRKLINSWCVFHFVHIRGFVAMPEGTDMSPEAEEEAQAEIDRVQTRLEACLTSVDRYDGRLVVKVTGNDAGVGRAVRIRGQPFFNSASHPGKSVYMSQWPGVHQFWQWHDSPDGQEFARCLDELAGSGFESLLFTASLDFRDFA